MNDDHPSTATLNYAWLERIRKALCFHPQDRQELTDLLRSLESRNLIDPDALAMIEGALQVSEMQVRDIMVPKAQMAVVEEDADPKDFIPTIIESGHSRFPVIDSKREQVVGILLAKDLLGYLAHGAGQPFDIRDVLRPPVFVPESKRLNVLLRDFRSSRNHMAIVVDEYGRMAGLVSIEDVIEQVVGDITDEHDIHGDDYIKKHRDDRYIVKARIPIEEFNEYFHSDFQDDEYDTIGGLLLKAFGHMPARGESIEYGGFKFRVIRADQRRVHLLRVVPMRSGGGLVEHNTANPQKAVKNHRT
jgi:magnesium and cobalt transporter